MSDPVNHPKHYTFGKYEVIDVIEDWSLDYHLGNAVKYIARANHKRSREQDLRKAIWYLQRAVGENRNEQPQAIAKPVLPDPEPFPIHGRLGKA